MRIISQFYLLVMVAALLVGGFVPSVAGEESAGRKISWPEGVEGKIEEAISIKKAAFKEHVRMRTKDGAAAIAFGRCMDEIASTPGMADLEPVLSQAEGTDLQAKIALWALDRQRRPGEYLRFAEYYVNCPKDIPAYYARGMSPENLARRRRIDPHVLRPRAVDAADVDEKNRLILEYNFFAPPAGGRFKEDFWRSNLAGALDIIHDQKSLLMVSVDHVMQGELRPAEEGQRLIGVGDGLELVLNYRSKEAFSVFATLWKYPAMRKITSIILTQMHDQSFMSPFRKKPDEQRALVDAWDALAKLEWKTDDEKALAAFILALPPLK